ncbi:MAG: elongation factor Ts [Chloroflexi bacterium]|nr:elongation factor Ts [Chloroflexota bacterium]MCL5952334.1 elongation factor Ts [Chloroflexota bacterium]
MAIPTEQIKKLRELTGAGVLETKHALEQANGDFDQAAAVLRAKGQARAEKKAERAATQGLIETYVHSDIHSAGKVGAMLELNCETDFVARTAEFQQLAHDLVLHIAATNPKYISPNDIPTSVREQAESDFRAQVESEGKKGPLVDKIIQGKMESYFKDHCLLRQPFIRDESITIQDLVQSVAMKMRENIVVRRFVRYQLGE